MPDQLPRERSESVENFLKAIYTLQQQTKRVSTNALAEYLNITAPSVTDMAQRLVHEGFVDYQKYRGVRLTRHGERTALQIIRRHRLIELYLVEELGYRLHEVHGEAEQLEHAVSDRFIEAIAAKLGQPDLDPHGDPIPTAAGDIARLDLRPLAEWPLHTPASVRRFYSNSPEMLQHIMERGFQIDSGIEVLARDPFEGPLTVRVGADERVIGFNVASCILVEA